MRDIKWFIDQGIRLTPPDLPRGILDTLNEQALPLRSHFSSLLLDFEFGVDSPEQSDEVLFLTHFMRDKMSQREMADFAEDARKHGSRVLAHPSPIPFYDASTLVGIALITHNAKWIENARKLLPAPPRVGITNIVTTLREFGPLATMRWIRALRFTEPHTTLASNRVLADLFIDMCVNDVHYPTSPRLLHLYLSMLPFLPQAMKENMAWIASECANDIVMAGHPLIVSSAVLINSNWDEITPVRPEEKKERK